MLFHTPLLTTDAMTVKAKPEHHNTPSQPDNYSVFVYLRCFLIAQSVVNS